MHLTGSRLLEGPRGRHLCLDVASRRSSDVSRAWFHRDAVGLVEALTVLDPAPVRAWDERAFVEPVDGAVSSGMGWQEPHDEDVVAADRAVVAALRPVADAVASAPGAQWWGRPVDLDALRASSRHDAGDAPFVPLLTGTAERLAEWRAEAIEEDVRAGRERPDDPRAAWGGAWWSTPAGARLPSTTRPFAGVGSVELVWEEDSFRRWDAHVRSLRTTRAPRVYEIDGAEAWAELVRRHPFDVTWSRRHDWFRVTGRDGRWALPDWAAVAREWDGVHLTVLGYLAAATRLVEVDADRGTLLVGWNPDQTWWLADVLEPDGPPERWRTSQEEEDGALLEWRPVED